MVDTACASGLPQMMSQTPWPTHRISVCSRNGLAGTKPGRCVATVYFGAAQCLVGDLLHPWNFPLFSALRATVPYAPRGEEGESLRGKQRKSPTAPGMLLETPKGGSTSSDGQPPGPAICSWVRALLGMLSACDRGWWSG
jgi:hypothetical protein